MFQIQTVTILKNEVISTFEASLGRKIWVPNIILTAYTESLLSAGNKKYFVFEACEIS